MSRLFDFIRGLLSLAVILALLAGIPALLIAIVGFPLPTEAPSASLIRSHIEDGDVPDLFLIKTLAVVVWVVWAQLAVAMVVEMIALVGGRAANRAPVIPAVQVFAGKLVATTVLIASSLSVSRSATAAPITPISAEESAQIVEPDPELLARSEMPGPTVGPFSVGPDAAREFADAAAASRSTASARYLTRTGDSWWDMAERLLGDGMRWSEVRDLNLGSLMADGETVSDTTETVRGGWWLQVPSDADPRLLEAGGIPGDEMVFDTPAAPAPERPYSLVYEGPSGAVDLGPGIPYQVVEGDDLWSIAERHLGDPLRWPEIFENSTDLQQTFDRRISDPDLIWPDSILWLPTDAVEVPAADVDLVREVVGGDAVASSTAGPAELQADDLAAITEAAEAILAAPEQQSPASGSVPPPAPTPNPEPDPVPSATSDRDSTPATSADRTDITEDPPQSEPPAAQPVRSSESGRWSAPDLDPATAAFGAGGVLVASGMLGTLNRRRRLRLAEAGEGSIPAPPPLELVELETVLRNSADEDRVALVHRAIASLADRPVGPGEPLPAPEVIRISNRSVEVVQQSHDPDLPAPWTVVSTDEAPELTGRTIAVSSIEALCDHHTEVDEREVVAPTAVTVGGGLLVNLEAVGVVAVEGAAGPVAGLLQSMVHELATGPSRHSVEIHLSDWLAGADLYQHVLCGPLDRVVSTIGPWLEDVELSLAASGSVSAHASRATRGGGSIPGPKIIFADEADAERLAPIVGLARRRSLPLAIVFSGHGTGQDLDPALTLCVDQDTVTVQPYGFAAAVQELDTATIDGIAELIRHAENAPMVARPDPPPQSLSLDPGGMGQVVQALLDQAIDPAQAPTEETPEHEVVTEVPPEEEEITDQSAPSEFGLYIRVLGPVEIEGCPLELREEERSLLTFLAVGGPATGLQLRDAVWPGFGIEDDRFESLIERLRCALGPSFPSAPDGRYRLRSVQTDLGASRRWISQAAGLPPDKARNLLQLALTDVRGRPFQRTVERFWQWTADHKLAVATQATTILTDACFDLCDNAYEAGDLSLAKWACDVGSVVDPLHETITTRRVQLLQAMGQPGEAVAAVEAWEALYSAEASRPAPRGPRIALQAVEAVSPYVG